MDLTRTGIIIKSGLIALILLLFAYPALPQNETEQIIVTDTVDDDADLFDENTNYKEMYKDLNKDGEWFTIKETDLDADSEDGEEVTTNVTNIRIINVWRPKGLGAEWSPYGEGRWVYTYAGWMWVTDYNWGWATYHYGRWIYSDYYGWVWMPGRYWAPNWVQWGYNSQCIGWYPIYPRWRGWHHGRNHHGWHDRYYHKAKHHHWTFVNRNQFTEKVNEKNRLDPNGNKKILEGAKTKVIVKYDGKNFVNIGPRVEVIEKNTGQKIQPREIKLNTSERVTKIDDKSVSIYRNDITKKSGNTSKIKDKNTINNEQRGKNDGEKIKKTKTNNNETAPDVNYEGTKEKTPGSKDSKKGNTKEDAQIKKENKPGNENPGDDRRKENSPPNGNNGSKSNDYNNNKGHNEGGQSNEGSREKGNTESKSTKRK
jgi:hypothetical protein